MNREKANAIWNKIVIAILSASIGFCAAVITTVKMVGEPTNWWLVGITAFLVVLTLSAIFAKAED